MWLEREIKSVANVAARDIAEFLPLAAAIPIRPDVRTHPLEKANAALVEIKHAAARGTRALAMD